MDDQQAGPGPDSGAGLGAEIGAAIVQIARRFDEELYALTREQLAAQWFWRWDPGQSVAVNIYEFTTMLDLHRGQCRRWEEHHNGHQAVVGRVRDIYLMPRIREFEALLARHVQWETVCAGDDVATAEGSQP